MFLMLLYPTWWAIWILPTVMLFAFVASFERLRYTLKFIFFILSTSLFFTVSVPWSIIHWRQGDWARAQLNSRFLENLGRFLGMAFRIRGKENIVESNTGCVVIMNHQSALDLCVLGFVWPMLENAVAVVKKELLYYPIFGVTIWLMGVIFLDRQRSEKAHTTLNNATEAIRDKKAKIVLFPEGHRHLGRTLQPFKKGGFHLAIDAQCPIQPIVISRYCFLNPKTHRFDAGICNVTVLPAIPTKGLTKEDLPELMEKCYEVMNKVYAETSEEVLNEHLKELKDE